jgi:hypothetical protein
MKTNYTYNINRGWQKPVGMICAPAFGTEIDTSRGPSM